MFSGVAFNARRATLADQHVVEVDAADAQVRSVFDDSRKADAAGLARLGSFP